MSDNEIVMYYEYFDAKFNTGADCDAVTSFEKLNDTQLQAYADLIWATLDLLDEVQEKELWCYLRIRRDRESNSSVSNSEEPISIDPSGVATTANRNTNTESQMSMMEAILFAVSVNEGDCVERVIPDVKERLLTFFALTYPTQICYPPADASYVNGRGLSEGEIVSLKFTDIFATTSGHDDIEYMFWEVTKQYEMENVLWEVMVSESGIRRLREHPSSYITVESTYGFGTETEAEPLLEPAISLSSRPLSTFRHLEKGRLRLSLKDKIIEFSVNQENNSFEFWDGTKVQYYKRRGRHVLSTVKEATIGVAAPVKVEVKFEPKQKCDTQPVTAEILEKYLSRDEYPKFWSWFFRIALLGFIEGDTENLGRTSWFLRTRKGGVRLTANSMVTVDDVEHFLGRAVWKCTDDERRMSFRDTRDAKYLTGVVRKDEDNRDFLLLKWKQREPRRNGKRVNGNLRIGAKYADAGATTFSIGSSTLNLVRKIRSFRCSGSR